MGNALGSHIGVGTAKPLTGALVPQLGSGGGMSLSRGYWGPQRPEPPCLAPLLTWAEENMAPACAWVQQG